MAEERNTIICDHKMIEPPEICPKVMAEVCDFCIVIVSEKLENPVE